MRRTCVACESSREAVPRFKRHDRRGRFGPRRLTGDISVRRSSWLDPGDHPYAVAETIRNLAAFPASVTVMWLRLRSQLVVVDDVLTIDKPAVFPVEKDRPILFGALASADVLSTLDRADFGRLVGSRFYGLVIMTPGMWLSREREAGRLRKA